MTREQEEEREDSAGGEEEARAPRRWLRVVAFGLLFLALTVAGAWWAISSAEVSAADFAPLLDFPLRSKILVVFFALGVIGTDMWRLRIVGNAIGVKVGFMAALDATVANNFFSWITPGAALGEPATIFMLGRRGVPWDAAGLIAFGKTVTSVALVFGLALSFLALGLGPDLHWAIAAPFVSGTSVVAVLVAILVIGTLWPQKLIGWLRRRRARWRLRPSLNGPRVAGALDSLVGTTEKTIGRLITFKEGGLRGSVAIMFGHVVYYATYIGLFLSLATCFGGTDLLGLAAMLVIYQTFTYAAPTPGGSGLSEATAEVFFGGLLAPEAAVATVLLYRGLTIYSHIALGLIYLPIVGGMREILAWGSKPKSDAP